MLNSATNVAQPNLLYQLIPSGIFLTFENSAQDFLGVNFGSGISLGFADAFLKQVDKVNSPPYKRDFQKQAPHKFALRKA